MAQFDQQYARPGYAAGTAGTFDQALRSYMLSVYNYMAGGVALTGLVAYAMNQAAVSATPTAFRMGKHFLTPFGQAVYGSPLMWVLALAPLAFVFFLSFRVYKMSVGATQLSFWLFSAVMGASLSTILLRYTGQSVAQVFFITAAAFGALSVFGYVTKRDLSGMGSFLIMGVVGLILAGVVNIFMQSSALQFAISALGLLIFSGLTAYDTQQIKDNFYAVAHDSSVMTKSAIMGALNLYLDFINMFQSLLGLVGNRD
jgi:uncharacterized protein